MPIYEYLCPNGHKSERVVLHPLAANEPLTRANCPHCLSLAALVPSMTGTPILKAGIGGFYKPNAQ